MDAFFQTQMGLEATPPKTLQEAARDSLKDYLSSFPWDAFFTATFATSMRYSAGVFDKLRPILKLISYRSVGVAEQHISGFWHAHGLLYYHHQPGFTYTIDNSNAEKRLAKNGYVSLGVTRSSSACATYISKYLTKSESSFEYEFIGARCAWRRE